RERREQTPLAAKPVRPKPAQTRCQSLRTEQSRSDQTSIRETERRPSASPQEVSHRLGRQVGVTLLEAMPMVFVLFRGWKFGLTYSVLCAVIGILSVLAWVVPALQRVVFVPGVP